MIRTVVIAASLLALGPTPAFAAPCRSANGKFIKCASAAPAKPIRCKDAKGKFAKCGELGAKPM
jgi:hypothetical protein